MCGYNTNNNNSSNNNNNTAEESTPLKYLRLTMSAKEEKPFLKRCVCMFVFRYNIHVFCIYTTSTTPILLQLWNILYLNERTETTKRHKITAMLLIYLCLKFTFHKHSFPLMQSHRYSCIHTHTHKSLNQPASHPNQTAAGILIIICCI